MTWSSQKKKQGIFCTVYFVQWKPFKHLCFISMYSVLNRLSEYTYFYKSKNITSYTFLLVFKIDKSLQCILKDILSKYLIAQEFSKIHKKNQSNFCCHIFIFFSFFYFFKISNKYVLLCVLWTKVRVLNSLKRVRFHHMRVYSNLNLILQTGTGKKTNLCKILRGYYIRELAHLVVLKRKQA